MLHRFKQYLNELNSINLLEFNKFIFKQLLLNAVRKENLAQWIIAIGILLFSLHFQNTDYVFLPQSSLTTFGLFLVLNFAFAVILMAFYPLVIIATINYLVHLIPLKIKNKYFIVVKIIFMLLCFFSCVEFIASNNTSLLDKLDIVVVWLGFYFFLVNLYLNFHSHSSLIITQKTRFIYMLIFTLLLIRPVSFLFEHTSGMFSNVNINPHMFLDSNNCKLVATPSELITESSNMLENNPKYFEQTEHGCFFYKNTIRLGFASDFALLIKKNLRPIQGNNGVLYNEWVRLNCFSSTTMCFSEDNLIVPVADDKYSRMLSNQKKYLHPIK